VPQLQLRIRILRMGRTDENTMDKASSSRVEIVEKDLSYAIVGCGMQAYNELGDGYEEKIYGRALDLLLVEKGLKVEREVPVKVVFRGVVLGTYRVDRVVEGRICVELKATEQLAKIAHQQIRSCLKASGYKLGLILHFGARFSSHRVLAPWLLTTTRNSSSDSSNPSASYE
jgi:GxxExxY protein